MDINEINLQDRINFNATSNPHAYITSQTPINHTTNI